MSSSLPKQDSFQTRYLICLASLVLKPSLPHTHLLYLPLQPPSILHILSCYPHGNQIVSHRLKTHDLGICGAPQKEISVKYLEIFPNVDVY